MVVELLLGFQRIYLKTPPFPQHGKKEDPQHGVVVLG